MSFKSDQPDGDNEIFDSVEEVRKENRERSSRSR